MFSKIATESLSQRGRSELYKSMTDVYQKAQDALYELKNLSTGQIEKILKSIRFSETLRDVIIKHTGIPISKVELLNQSNWYIAFVPKINNKFIYRSNMQAMTQSSFLEGLTQFYDDRKSKFAKSITIEDYPNIFNVVITVGLFKQRNKDGSLFFSPEELTGITLHELGHADYFIRTALRAQKSLMDASDIISFVNQALDKQVIIKTIDILLKNKSIYQEWGKSLSILKEEFIKSNDDTDLRKMEFISMLSTIMIEDIGIRQLTFYNQMLGHDKKTNASSVYSVDYERSADEYAARHGAYTSLISALSKMDRSEGKGYKEHHLFVYGFEASLVSRFLYQFKTNFGINAEEVSNGYDPIIRRLELIVETAKHAFHDDIPKPVIEELKREIIESEIYLNQYRQADYRSSRLRLKKWKDNIKSFGRIIASPFIDRLGERYDVLHDANRSLSRHSLYYLAKK